jgi:acyl-CoA reductase-like NAD-dependent aldehyde dehydrogenase
LVTKSATILDHALYVANDTSYGLSSSVMTRDIDTALKFAEQLEAGMVHIMMRLPDSSVRGKFRPVAESAWI